MFWLDDELMHVDLVDNTDGRTVRRIVRIRDTEFDTDGEQQRVRWSTDGRSLTIGGEPLRLP